MRQAMVGLAVFAVFAAISFTIPILAVAVGLFIIYALWIVLTADSIKINMEEEQHHEE